MAPGLCKLILTRYFHSRNNFIAKKNKLSFPFYKVVILLFYFKIRNMKQALSLILCMFALCTSKASISDLFAIDKIEIASEIEDLTNLETYLYSHPNLSYEDILNTNPALTSNIILTKNSSSLGISIYNDRYPDDNYYLIYAACSCCVSVGIGIIYYSIASSN